MNDNNDKHDEFLKRQIAEHGEVFLRELARTHERFEERVRELSAVRRIVDALKYIQNARRVFEGIIDAIIDETNAENCSLMLVDRETNELMVKAARSQTDTESRYYDPENLPATRLHKGEGIAGWVAEHGEPVSIPDIAQDTRFVTATQAIGPIGSILCVPLQIDGEVVGIVNMSHPHPNAFTDEDARLMMLVADQVAIALNSVQLFEDTRQLNSALSQEVDNATEALRQVNSDLRTEMTERKNAEQELVRTQRLRAAGELSAGVSHNLNNILTGIWGPTQLLMRATRDPHLLEHAQRINTFAERATDLVARLHQATRADEEQDLQAIAVENIVQEAVETARPRWKDEPESRGITIRLHTELGDLPPARCTASGLYDLLINLIFNAVDALPAGGDIIITATSDDTSVQLNIRDTGIGMDEQTRQRIFEPFFTTKADVGRGLGLSTVYSTLTRWGGNITADSTLAQGTTFVITLPRWTEGTDSEPVSEPETSEVRRGRLLIVDDEIAIAEILTTLLENEHDIDMVASGDEALNLIAPGKYDVALLDLGRPGMSGDALAFQLKQIDPNLVLVMTTGWKLDDNDSRLTGFDFWIQKPFRGLDRVRDLVTRSIHLHDERTGQ